MTLMAGALAMAVSSKDEAHPDIQINGLVRTSLVEIVRRT